MSTTKHLALLTKEVPNMKELMDNAIKLNQLLQTASTIDTPMVDNKGDEPLILVMISSMKHIIDNPKSTGTVGLEEKLVCLSHAARQKMNICSEVDTISTGSTNGINIITKSDFCTNDSAYDSNIIDNGERDHTNHKVHTYKYASNFNGLKWAIKAMKTKTDLNL